MSDSKRTASGGSGCLSIILVATFIGILVGAYTGDIQEAAVWAGAAAAGLLALPFLLVFGFILLALAFAGVALLVDWYRYRTYRY